MSSFWDIRFRPLESGQFLAMCRLSSSFHAPRHASNSSVSSGSSTSINVFSGVQQVFCSPSPRRFRGLASLCLGRSRRAQAPLGRLHKHLHEVLYHLCENGLTINPLKSVFGQEAVVQFPGPSTHLELQCFLGLINFYQCFLRGAADFLLLLTEALQGPGKSMLWPQPPSSSTLRPTSQLAPWTTLPTAIMGPALLLQEAVTR